MALTPWEIDYIKRLRKEWANDESVLFYLEKRRAKEAEMNTPKEQWFLGKTAWFLQNVWAGAIQAGWELAVGLPWQLTRLLPWDQSADPNSFYNQTQGILNSTKQDMQKQGVETDWAGFWFGKWVMNIAWGSVLSGWALQLAQKSKLLTQLGLKVGIGLPWQMLKGAAQWATQWLGFDLASGEAPWAGTVAGGVIGGASPLVAAGAKLVWKWLSETWKFIYKTAFKPNTDEAAQIIQSTAKWTVAPITRADTALKYGIQGREKDVGVQWVRESQKIFKDTITPALEKSKATHKVDDLFAQVEKQITSEKSALRKQELMEWLEALKDEFKTTGKTVFTTADLQAEKSALDKFAPTKLFRGKEVAQGYNQVKNTLANVMREQVRTDLATTGIKNAKELYRDYANLVELEKIGIKWLTEWGFKWWTGTLLSAIYDKILTPVKTIWWNTLYRVGKWIEFLWPSGIKTLWGFLKRWGYKLVWDVLQKD